MRRSSGSRKEVTELKPSGTCLLLSLSSSSAAEASGLEGTGTTECLQCSSTLCE